MAKNRVYNLPCRGRCATGVEMGAKSILGIHEERGKPDVFPLGKQAVRQAVRTAGIGCRRKRKLSCNGVDRVNTQPDAVGEPAARVQTSDWSLITRKFGEQLL